MILIYGQALYGKVDKVPGLFHIGTQFFHLYYIPLWPLGSYLVPAEAEDELQVQGMPLPLCLKSVLAGWVRAALILTLVLGLGIGCAGLMELVAGNRVQIQVCSVVVPLVLGAAAGLLYRLTQRVTYATRKRALELGAVLGLAPQIVEASVRQEIGIPRFAWAIVLVSATILLVLSEGRPRGWCRAPRLAGRTGPAGVMDERPGEEARR